MDPCYMLENVHTYGETLLGTSCVNLFGRSVIWQHSSSMTSNTEANTFSCLYFLLLPSHCIIVVSLFQPTLCLNLSLSYILPLLISPL